jgi:cell division protein ZapA
MAQKVKTVVKIAGREYTVRAFETEEYIHKVAIYVNRRMEEVEKAQPSLSTSMTAVLTAINLGDEVLKLQAEIESLQDQLKEMEEASKSTDEDTFTGSLSASSAQSAPVIYDVSRKGKR